MYQELYSKNTKVSKKKKNVFKPNDNETRLLEPVKVQNEIDTLVSKISKGRSFIRPSGTEDVVRIYAEGENQKEVDDVINKLIDVLKEY